jgi:hypothetical protein
MSLNLFSLRYCTVKQHKFDTELTLCGGHDGGTRGDSGSCGSTGPPRGDVHQERDPCQQEGALASSTLCCRRSMEGRGCGCGWVGGCIEAGACVRSPWPIHPPTPVELNVEVPNRRGDSVLHRISTACRWSKCSNHYTSIGYTSRLW